MDLLHRLEHWGERHHPKWVDIVRISLGLFLCYKGIQFPEHASLLINKIPNALSGNSFMLMMLTHFILGAHLLGGILLIAGVLTRFACLIQIPILLGAIIFINSSREILQPFSELYISIIVLLLLLYFLVAGNGTWSLARYLEEDKSPQKV
jgi:uncharacterized membrane protein YphA (DoxX/SURF4 family)